MTRLSAPILLCVLDRLLGNIEFAVRPFDRLIAESRPNATERDRQGGVRDMRLPGVDGLKARDLPRNDRIETEIPRCVLVLVGARDRRQEPPWQHLYDCSRSCLSHVVLLQLQPVVCVTSSVTCVTKRDKA